MVAPDEEVEPQRHLGERLLRLRGGARRDADGEQDAERDDEQDAKAER